MTASAFIPASSAPLRAARPASSFTPDVSSLQSRPRNALSPPPAPAAPSDATVSTAPPTAVASNDFFRSVADSIRRDHAAAAQKAGKPVAPTDLHTMTETANFLPPFRAVVAAVSPLTPHGDYVHLALDVSAEPRLVGAHVAPGQSVHLARVPGRASARRRAAVQAVIASPPREDGTMLEFLLSRGADPCGLTRLRVGDAVAVGPVCGPALAVTAHLEKRIDLLFLADSPQAFAAARSLVEWDTFRAMSGSGANRTSSVTVFYALPSHRSIPYADRFSDWSVFGVNIVPVSATPLLEYLAGRNSLRGDGASAMSGAAAIVAARSNAEFEKYFMQLVRLGVARDAVHRMSADDLAAGGRDAMHHMPAPSSASTYASSSSSSSSSSYSSSTKTPSSAHSPSSAAQPHGMPDAAHDYMRRMQLEREVWAEWVKLRDELRAELRAELDLRRRQGRGGERAAEVQRVEWQGWQMRNRDAWSDNSWDNDAWQTYWQAWGTPRDDESAHNRRGNAWNAGGFDSAHRGGQRWNQQDSAEYWDWVGRGAGASGSASGHSWDGASPGGGGGGGGGGYSQSYSSYSEQYNGYGSWGNSNNQAGRSGYQQGGYKYQYEETDEDRKSQQYGYGTSGGGPGGNWWTGWWNDKQKQSGSGSNQWRNRRGSTGGRSSSSGGGSGGGGRYGQQSRQGENIDLYGILGINSSASRAEIKKAYRQKAMDHHPDRHPDRQDEATVIMKKIVVAWTVLKDDSRRRTYDQTGVAGF